MRPCLFLLFCLPLFGQVKAPQDKEAPVRPPAAISLAPKPLRSGTQLREERQISSTDGQFHFTSSTRNEDAITRYTHRLALVRRIQGTGAEEVEVSDHGEDCAAYSGPPGPPENTQPGPLQTTRLRARQKLGRWSYELIEKKPNDLQKRCLVELGVMTDLLDASTWGIGSQTRRPGESWKPEFRDVRGKARGMLVPRDYEIAFTGLEEHQGESCALLQVKGSLRLERPVYEGTLDLTFTGSVLRRVSDGLDLETVLTGSLDFTGPVTSGGTAGTLKLAVPFKARRTQKLLPR